MYYTILSSYCTSITFLNRELKMNSFRNASTIYKSATDADYIKKFKTVFRCESYMSCEIKSALRVNYTKLRLSSHKFLVERARWGKVKIPYAQRRCTLCSSGDIEDEYHMIMICEHFRDVRVKYIKPFYYKRPSMWKFVQLMNSTSKRDRFKLMLFLKITFKLYGDTL